ncbi:ATP-dependent DNA helicase Q-like 4A isoform X1 [Macadamia integrifolia]|uniref:ATP-dependent DNA helicase Q-like 4A isoform X1 n=1 Tax=Macadamia integrifolia TaxID=60698 RepID=UPI001C4FA318|nr:ATP-dependent DNA helicase Q-like 4A isoform X1 [Macadamia integrifolia]XP_042507113.1 ATP-dependent DNA helicase Q-like 4A isoform X1 [Macadamia integrifolia]XP_042507118.1 ATP-dependent DNA helicase Q-like 4A isoform X1 [Macadamia integrifolia]XP_042507126.1 ATP-dependent DNA helicase Q-like 4A isoform X1 [Macadamia integrifolia]
MTKGKSLSKTNAGRDSNCDDKPPKVNWSHHANAHSGFSCQNKFLSSNFLLSLQTQMPRGGSLIERSMSCQINTPPRMQSSAVNKAWQALSSLNMTCRSYLKPGVTGPVAQNIGLDNLPSRKLDSCIKKSTLWGSSDLADRSYESSVHKKFQTHQNLSDSSGMVGEPGISMSQSRISATEDGLGAGQSKEREAPVQHSFNTRFVNGLSVNDKFQMHQNFRDSSAMVGEFGNSLPQSRSYPSEDGVGPGQEKEREASVRFSTNARIGDGPSNNHCVNREEGNGGSFVNEIEDDDILKEIDVDKIVLEHYQTTCTPQSLVSKPPPSTSVMSKDNVSRPDGTCLPQELCTECNHGLKLGLCPEAARHLQEMKDMLISISNELLDNIGDLSPTHIEKLREERLQLNKQIQQLEKCLHSFSMDEERQRSHFSATTATSKGFQYETPLAGGFRINPVRLDPQFDLHNEPGSCGKWNSSSLLSSSVDRFDVPPGPRETEPYVPNLIDVNYIEGSNDSKWSSRDFPWTKKLEANNKKVFGNHSFRPNQREVINATMSGYDVFVLMPTGGGKSLTYQLPALIFPGITLVVSPLVSLIQDQIMHLLQANIPAAYLSANMEWSEQQEILRELNSDCCKYKLLYVTPEKVAKSDVLLRHLESLHARESLSRIVIDEAHCVSQWGHDFRPDYQGLGILKKRFPKTPVLALTATATASVKEDVVQALGLVDCVVFRQSFNRPNLSYSVISKTKKCLDDIDKFIKENHFDECGIIYCLSRMDCEKVAEKLQECGHKAAFYHGSLDPQQRASVQKQWSKDEINIICATVAFGMGINKPDVRFVIHHSLPKSIEGYHQECGRAGRDGQRSSCVLYYSYSDYIRIKHMISQGVIEQSPLASVSRHTSVVNSGRILETNIENLLRMVSYCEDDIDCRRFLQLVHFGEKFDPANCGKTCDNCSKTLSCVEKDVTDIARHLLELVKSTGQQHSSAHILEVYRGSLSQNVKKYRHDTLSLHGSGKHLPKGDASRVLRHLVIEELLLEDVKKSDIYGSLSSVLKVNESKANNLCFGGQKIILRFPASTKEAKMSKSGVTPAKGLLSGKISPPQSETPGQPQSVDLDLSAKLYSSLRMLRTALLKEAGDGVYAYHIFQNATLQQISKRVPRSKEELLDINGIGKAKISKYGDRLLEVIESTINEHYNSSGSNDSTGTVKRRRDTSKILCSDTMEDEDFTESSGLPKKRVTKGRLKKNDQRNNSEVLNYDEKYLDDDLVDLDDSKSDEDILGSDLKIQKNAGGRVLPSWSTPGNKVQAQGPKLFQEYAFDG